MTATHSICIPRVKNSVSRQYHKRYHKRLGQAVCDFQSLENRLLMSTYTVNNLADDGTVGTLRWAVEQANLNTGSPNTVNFVAGLSGVVTLNEGLLEFTGGNTTVQGLDGGSITIAGGGNAGVFQVDSGAIVEFSGLNITGGNAVSGGGINSSGTTTIIDTSVFGNAANDGGGVFVGGGTFTAQRSTISENDAADSGGGIDISAGTLTILNSTISANAANTGGGLASSGGSTTLNNSIVDGNTLNDGVTADDISGSLHSANSNLIGVGGGLTSGTSGNLVGVANPMLSFLGDYGGNTQTMVPLDGSPAIDAGNNSLALSGADQRGLTGIVNAKVDIGAVETQAATVNTLGDDPVAFGMFSLRDAVNLASAQPDAATASFDPTVFPAGIPETITLSDGAVEVSGGDVTIQGAGANFLSISGNGNGAVFQIDPGAMANLSAMTLTDGNSGLGGGVLNFGTLTLTNVTVSGNSAELGAGIYNSSGVLTLDNSTLLGNSASDQGGGIYSTADTITISDSTLSDNFAASDGGAIYADTSAGVLIDSTVSNNTAAGDGGGIYLNGGSFAVVNSTLAGNAASGQGGAIFDALATFTIHNGTLSANIAPSGGGGILVQAGGGDATIYNTIVSGNSLTSGGTANDISGSLDQSLAGGQTPSSNNLIGIGGGLSAGSNGNLLGVVNPELGPLQNNGGPTQTMTLMPASPAINAGKNSLAVDENGNPLTTDQRGTGFARVVFGVVDIGAYEATTEMLSAGFSNLTASAAISDGTATVALGGTVSSGSQFPASGETVAITLNGVTHNATIGSSGAFSSSFNTSALAPSLTAYSVTYSYAGDANLSAVSNSTTTKITVNKATPTVTIASAPSSITYDGKTDVTSWATASVTGISGATAPSGSPTLAFYAGSSASGTALSSSPINPGTYTVVANYAGDTNYSSAQSHAVTFTISKATPTVTIASAPSTLTYDGTSDITTWAIATISGITGAAAPTGSATLSFFAGSSASGTALSSAPVDAGTYTVVAKYAGDGNYNSAQSHAVTFTVNKVIPTVAVTGGTFTFTGSPQGTTGSVTGVHGASLGAAVLSYSSTSYGPSATPPTQTGTYTVTGSFAGNSDYLMASSSATIVINPAKTTGSTTLTVASVTGTQGQHVQLSATLLGANGKPLNCEKVTFTLNGKVIGSAHTNSSGVAIHDVELNDISPGTYATGLQVSFAGDKNNAAASATGSITVNEAPIVAHDLDVDVHQLVASLAFGFSHAGNPAASDFTAMINWGDGSAPSSATVVADGTCDHHFVIKTNHTYAAPKTTTKYTVTVTITSKFGATKTVTDTITIQAPKTSTKRT